VRKQRESPARYPIRAVSKLTGIGIDTLRAWERRHSAVTPIRDDRGRLYTEADIARLRLANIMLDEKAYDEALKVLDAKHGAAFDPGFSATRGDVLVAQGKKEEARSAYKAALEKADPKDASLREWVQLRLDALGGAK